jgi:hypothetical protein
MMVVGMFTSFYLCSLYFEQVKGWGPIHTGLAFLPQTLIVAVMALAVTRRLVRRFGLLPVMFAGIALLGTIAAAHTTGLLADGAADPDALAGGYRFAYRFLAAAVLAGLAVAVRFLARPRPIG